MDLKVYYQKLRQVESSIAEPQVVIISQATPDGGRAGVATEVPRTVAARMIVERTAHLATKEEAQKFREGIAESKQLADELAAASRLQVTVVPKAEWRRSSRARKDSKS
jgi:hypothetical protein